MRAAARVACAMLCAVAFHAVLAGLAAACGWLSADERTLPQLDMSSVELSFSDAPDETAAPAVSAPPAPTAPPEPEVRPPPPPPPPTMELPPDPSAVPIPDPPHRDSLSPETPEAPDAEPPKEQPAPPRKDPPKNPPKEKPKEPPPPPSAPSAPAPSQAKVEVVEPPSPKSRIKKPEYPKGARERREEGEVILILSVNAEGVVVKVEIVESCGFSELEAAAVAVARKARFKPARQGGKAVPGRVRLPIQFKLKDG